MKHISLPDSRIPDYPDCQIVVDGASLAVLDHELLSSDAGLSTSTTALTPALAISTILHNWCPSSLTAFLDLDAWFSFTWIRRDPLSSQTIEIGRVGNQITFGTLDAAGSDWKLMITYNIALEGTERGRWIANPKECMKGEEDVTEVAEIERLAREEVSKWVNERVWQTGKRIKHEFFVEYAPMDVWGDGIPMNPHWLYDSLDLTHCTTCNTSPASSTPSETSDPSHVQLQRCGKCGTATYCSAECQKRDWPVHKHICSLGLEERGQMLAITEKGGLIAWDKQRMFAKEASGEPSKNPYLEMGTRKRCRPKEWFGGEDEEVEEDEEDDGENKEDEE